MRKSPLSTPGNANNFHRGRGQRRGYVYRQLRNDNGNYHRYSGFNNSPNDNFEGNMIPLSTSSPKFYQNRGERQQSGNLQNQRFSNTGISGSYNQRENFQNSPPGRGCPYVYPRFQHNQQPNNWRHNKQDQAWYRKLPISEILDMKSASEDPWADLERELENKKPPFHKKMINDSSVEIISERIGNADSSPNSSSDEATINISSSYDDSRQGSSVDLALESINFSQTSSDVIILSDDSLTSQNDSSLNKSSN